MLLTDGRRQVHDLGPVHTLAPWLMETIGYTGKTGTGGWGRERACKQPDRLERPLTAPAPQMTSSSTSKAIVAARPRNRRPRSEKQAYDRGYSARRREARSPEDRRKAREYQRQYMRDRRARERGVPSKP